MSTDMSPCFLTSTPTLVVLFECQDRVMLLSPTLPTLPMRLMTSTCDNC